MTFRTKISLFATFLSLSLCFQISANDESAQAAEVLTPLNALALTVKNDTIPNLLARVLAKTGVEYASTKVKATAWQDISAGDIGKSIGNTAVDELAPLPKSAAMATKHADLLLPLILAKISAGKVSTAEENKTIAVALLKKELGKGFFINPDFKQLKSLEDAGFFATDFAVEVFVGESEFNDTKDKIKKGLKGAVESKILTPFIMAYAGNDFALSLVKTKNKAVQKAWCGLFEKLVVSKILKAALL